MKQDNRVTVAITGTSIAFDTMLAIRISRCFC